VSGVGDYADLRSERAYDQHFVSSSRSTRPPPTMPNVENLHDVTFDRKQNPVYVRLAAIKKLTDFSW